MFHQDSRGLGRLAYVLVLLAPPMLGFSGWVGHNFWLMLSAPVPLLLAVPLLLRLEADHRSEWQETHYDGMLRAIGIGLAMCFVVPVLGAMVQIPVAPIVVILAGAELVVLGAVAMGWYHYELHEPLPESVFGLYGLESLQQMRRQRIHGKIRHARATGRAIGAR